MIKKLINEALVDHGFVSKLDLDNTSFYIRESGSAIRFAVLHNLDGLSDPAELNNRINHLAPDEFLRNPSFKKNCDLICRAYALKLVVIKSFTSMQLNNNSSI